MPLLAELHQQNRRNELSGTVFWKTAPCDPLHRLARWEPPKQPCFGEFWIVDQPGPDWRGAGGYKGGQQGSQLPKNLEHVEQAIRSSEKILRLDDDWDEEGSPGYEFETWKRAADFVRQHCYKAWRISGKQVPAPFIFPGPGGSIDVHWRTKEFELLVNIPADPSKPATFYGDDYADICIKGSITTSRENNGILQWLMR